MSEAVPLPVAQSWPWFQITDKYDKFNESKTAFKVWNSLKFFWNIKLFCENHEGCVIFWVYQVWGNLSTRSLMAVDKQTFFHI